MYNAAFSIGLKTAACHKSVVYGCIFEAEIYFLFFLIKPETYQDIPDHYRLPWH